MPCPTANHWPTLEEMEASYLHLLRATFGDNQTQVARILGVDRKTVYRPYERLGIGGAPRRSAGPEFGDQARAPLLIVIDALDDGQQVMQVAGAEFGGGAAGADPDRRAAFRV